MFTPTLCLIGVVHRLRKIWIMVSEHSLVMLYLLCLSLGKLLGCHFKVEDFTRSLSILFSYQARELIYCCGCVFNFVTFYKLGKVTINLYCNLVGWVNLFKLLR